METLYNVHPQDAGFTPSYRWHGQERVIKWRHCNNYARQGSKEVKGKDGIYRTIYIVTCNKCNLKIISGHNLEQIFDF